MTFSSHRSRGAAEPHGREEPAGDAGVLTEHDVGSGEGVAHAAGEVTQVADGGAHQREHAGAGGPGGVLGHQSNIPLSKEERATRASQAESLLSVFHVWKNQPEASRNAWIWAAA